MRIVKLAATLFFLVIFALVAAKQLAGLGDRNGPIRRYRDTPVAPRVHLRAIAHGRPDSKVSPLCVVTREHYGSCGKSSCWKFVSSITATTGTLEPTWSSSPVQKSLSPSAGWRVEPSPRAFAVENANRIHEWQARAKKAGIDFDRLGNVDRLTEACVEEGESIYAVGCVDGENLDVCPGDKTWSFVPGDTPTPAIRAATNDMALALAGVLAALFALPLLWVPKRGALVAVLAMRSGHAARAMGWAYLLLIVLPVGLFFNFLSRSSSAGFVFFAFVLIGWGLLAGNLLLRRRRVLEALEPVLRTETSPLASATGTAELVVKARMTTPVSPILAPDPVAWATTSVHERYQVGKAGGRVHRLTLQPTTKLEVFDESGEGILDLSNAVLDIPETVTSYTKQAPPRLTARGIVLERHPNHTSYDVAEKRIEDGASLYVFGDVSDVKLHPDGSSGYRSVQGSPTLGGEGHPPLLVYQGDEAGLVASLRREARADSRIAFAAACVAGLASAIVVFLATR